MRVKRILVNILSLVGGLNEQVIDDHVCLLGEDMVGVLN